MVNNRIKSRRNELKMTVKQLAEKTGLTPAYISQLENGKRENPSTEVMDKIANALYVSIDYLLNKSENKELKKAKQKIEELNEENRIFFSKYEKLSPEAKKQMLKIIETFEEETQD
ncbi:helix-turn-helix domain-containing protein [Clostridium sp. HCP1S3_B4]|uniref:helix-turn-helix domain-containing protein n=1 Tax=unclassified Clostridium TaxID=2614128 RepID=UPI003F8C1CEF|nr:helix-turn-helix transcriptional regulator [Clostridiales bacterium]